MQVTGKVLHKSYDLSSICLDKKNSHICRMDCSWYISIWIDTQIDRDAIMQLSVASIFWKCAETSQIERHKEMQPRGVAFTVYVLECTDALDVYIYTPYSYVYAWTLGGTERYTHSTEKRMLHCRYTSLTLYKEWRFNYRWDDSICLPLEYTHRVFGCLLILWHLLVATRPALQGTRGIGDPSNIAGWGVKSKVQYVQYVCRLYT